MFRSIIRIRIAAGILVALMLSVQAYGQDKHFLWRVQSKTKSGFILGSIHLMKEEHYPLSRMIENAFKHSQSLAVEVNINEMDPGTLQRLAAEAFYPPGDSLEKHLSPSAVTLVRKQTEAMGMEFEFVKRQKPWFLATTLPAVALLKAGYDPR